jgi:hypothetical protein
MVRIDFLQGGNAQQFLLEGWSFQEPIGIWAVGAESSLLLPPPETSAAHRMTIKLFPLISPPKLLRQRIELTLNGTVVHRDEIDAGKRQISCVIPEGLLSTQAENRLVVSHPDAAAPLDVAAQGQDSRQLAVCFIVLELECLAAHGAAGVSQGAGHPLAAAQDNHNVRAIILCLGNAVGREIVQILRCFPPFDAAFEVRLATDIPSAAAILRSFASKDSNRLVAVWEQVSVAGEHAATEVRRLLPPRAVHVRYPHLSLNCLWPLQGLDPRLVAEPLYPGGRYPYTDIAGVRLHGGSGNLGDEDLYRAYLALSTRLMPDLREQWRLDELRWEALDSECGVKIANFLRTNFGRERLFYSPEMPCAPPIIYIAEHLMGSLLPRMEQQPSELYRDFSAFVQGYQGMFYDQAPIHPEVLKTFHVPGVSLDFEYRREYTRRTFREHILDYIRWTPWFAGARATEVGLGSAVGTSSN